MTDPILFKIFLSSPGDVPQERDDAQTVIEKINASGEFSRHFILRLFRWDDPAVILPMPVTDTPQKSVDSYMRLPSACDLVVVLFWSRMGSPLVMDAREYLSGTHYEYSEAMQGYQRVRKPTVWLYRCSEEPFVSQRDPKRDEKNEQFDRVEEFFKQFQDSDGRYTGGVNAYKTHPDFKALFEGQLLTYLRHRRDTPVGDEPIRPLDTAKPIFTGVEVAHEAMLRQWNALANWITTIKGDLAFFRQVERDAKLWVDRGRDTPQPLHEALVTFYKVLPSIGYALEKLAEPLKSYVEPEQTRLLREIDAIATTHRRRHQIGERLASIGDPRSGVGVDAHGLPQIDWLPVQPGGEITIEGQAFTVAPFYVAKYLITYAQFQTFLTAPDGFEIDRWWDGMPADYKKQALSSATAQYDNYPRDSVSWYQSVAFGRWLTHQLRGRALTGIATSEWIIGENAEIRLPTEWEWQWLAQNGGQARPYPWGSWDDQPRANTTEVGICNNSTAVGMYPHGAAACGALDVAGNLWEWGLNSSEIITNISIINNKYKVVRGGSFDYDQYDAAAASRNYSDPDRSNNYLGLRLVVSSPMASLISE